MAQLVERLFWEQEVACSSHATPIKGTHSNSHNAIYIIMCLVKISLIAMWSVIRISRKIRFTTESEVIVNVKEL